MKLKSTEAYFSEWKREIYSHKNLILLSIIFFITAIFLYFLAGTYVDKVGGSCSASDIILDNIPTVDLSFLFIYGATIIIFILILYPLIFRIKELHIVISQFSLLIVIRSFFVVLTHLKYPSDIVAYHFREAYQLLFLAEISWLKYPKTNWTRVLY